jgi:cyclopropane fatty-acyl-phospholipid synthase-like methyltransferase
MKQSTVTINVEANTDVLKKQLNELEEQVDRIVSKIERANSLSKQLTE